MNISLFTKLLCLFLLLPLVETEREYIREYYASGFLKAEGWIEGSTKEGYWIYYFKDGSIQKKGHYLDDIQQGYWYFYSVEKMLIKEGHFTSGQKNGWWIVYENNTTIKIQYIDGKREGFALVYTNKKLQKALKFVENKKTGEWTSLWSFKRDNPHVKF